MSHVADNPQLPYGAFELKATYQRNFLISQLLITLLVAATLTTAWLWPTSPKSEGKITLAEALAKGKFTIKPPPPIERQQVEIAGDRPSADIPTGVIPVPVDDDLIGIDDEPVLMSRSELSLAVDIGSGPGGGGEEAIGAYLEGMETFPDIKEWNKVEQIAEMVYRHSPEYPRLARMAGIEGDVIIKALVGRDGSVVEAVAFVSSGNGQLDEAAVRSAYKCKYRPAIQNSYPTAMWVTYTVQFRLDN